MGWERIGDVADGLLWKLRAANDREERRGLRLVSTQPASVAPAGGRERQEGAQANFRGGGVKRGRR